MSYVLAILGLAAVCVAWYLAQRWAGLLDEEPGGREPDADCDACEVDEAACPVVRLHERPRERSTAARR